MKIIDQTPLIDEKGNLGFTQRIQGMLKFGFNWPNELQAQKAIITYFDRNLEKGYTLIRNQVLGQSGIMVPMILLGPAGVFVINVTYLKGRYEAKGDSWNVESGHQFKPAPINLIQRTSRMARALTVFIERQGVKIPAPVESVIIAADPGLHIESVRPAIKVMMVDGIKSFVSGLASGAPALRADSVLDLVERVTNPRPPKEKTAPPPAPVATPRAAWEPEEQLAPSAREENVSRSRAIFSAAEEEKPFNAAAFDFAMVDESLEIPARSTRESNPAVPINSAKPRGRRVFGMTPAQFAVIAALFLCFVCILVIFFGYVYPRFS